jgi:RNA polymerase sigma-70 factor (ECF subfamily)
MSAAMERREFNRIVERYQGFVMRVAFTVVRSKEEADDIAQEVFLKLYTHMNRIEKPQSLKSWLARTATSTARDRLRWLKVRSWFGGASAADEVGTDARSPERLMAARERMAVVNAWAKVSLSNKERVIFQLRHGEEMTIDEIAEALRMNVNTVKTHLYRAMRKLGEVSDE